MKITINGQPMTMDKTIAEMQLKLEGINTVGEALQAIIYADIRLQNEIMKHPIRAKRLGLKT